MELEEMSAFFAARLNGYDEHMLRDIEGAKGFYPYTASLLPKESGARLLDLGCGTGLELEEYFRQNGNAHVTGIDLSAEMLGAMKEKCTGRNVELICGSYFDVPFGEECYAAAVSVESLHHFPEAQKLGLYEKLHRALKKGGSFVLTDYFAESEALEKEYFENLRLLKQQQGLADDVFYHYDTPLTVEHEIDVLKKAGFRNVQIMEHWEATYTLLAQ